MKQERCVIVEGAKELAEEKGLDSSQVVCEFESVCGGEECMKLTPNVTLDAEPNFYARLKETARIKGFT